MRSFCFALLLLCSCLLCAQDSLPSLSAIRTSTPPKIDGVLDEEIWKNAPVATDFLQDEPEYHKPSSQHTEVKIIYDDNAIYVGAFMYDTHPDSILHELGNRDDADLNSDYFFVAFDTYNKLIDCFTFGVTASGVQYDSKLADETFNAVWNSAVKINEKGWCAELRIPYSALRFPDLKVQNWRLQLRRNIRRRRETSRWAFVPKDDPNIIKYFGHLDGLSDIKPPLRLSMTPYVSAYAERAPLYNADGTYVHSNGFSYNAGADIKYGLDERFTIDMILLPDFGQVQSDQKIKNLSYREVTYDENRPFFKEGTELFSKNNLFYSRRIGRTPTLYYDIPFELGAGEKVISNPAQTKLINATKLSGRSNSGLGVGVFNALTAQMNAVIEDSLGNRRSVVTEPLTNYNIIVLDQQLKHSSSFYFINTNVIRDRGWGDANVTGTGFSFLNKKNTIKFSGDNALSQKFTRIDSLPSTFSNQFGYKYYFGLEKVGGNYTYGIKHEAFNNTYDQRDLGYYTTNNFRNYSAFWKYSQYQAGKYFRFSQVALGAYYSQNFLTGKRIGMEYDLNSFAMLKNYLAIFGGGGLSPTKNYDYYEPRVEGKVYINRRYYYVYAGISSDYRKRFAIDLKENVAQYINEGIDGIFYGTDLGLRFRFSDRFSLFYNFSYSFDKYNEGFAAFDSIGNPVIGGRQLTTYVNKIAARYIFTPNMALSLNARHYWNTGHYVKYYSLDDEGNIVPYPSYTANNDFNYNAFNIDLVYTWIFSPGSQLSVVYKNAIETNQYIFTIPRFDENFNNTLQSPQVNSISLKLLYYLDYQMLKRRKKD